MGRIEIAELEAGAAGATNSAEVFFQLGIIYSTGGSVPADYVTAHKWFNLAAMRGNHEAVRLRQEIAQQMSGTEIAAAQRAARAWLGH